MTSTVRSLLLLLGLALAATPACKKNEESAPPTDIDDETDDDDADDDDDDADDDADADEEILSQTLFEEQVQGNMDDVLDCYVQASSENAELAGKVIVTFTVAADGSVETAEIDESSSLNDEGMNSCLKGKFSGWTFAKPPSGEPMTLSFPFNLAPAS